MLAVQDLGHQTQARSRKIKTKVLHQKVLAELYLEIQIVQRGNAEVHNNTTCQPHKSVNKSEELTQMAMKLGLGQSRGVGKVL